MWLEGVLSETLNVDSAATFRLPMPFGISFGSLANRAISREIRRIVENLVCDVKK